MPENPRSIAFFDCSGPYSRGVHQLWFCDGEYVHLAAGAADFQPRNQHDDQFYRIIDVRNPSKPEEVGRWWMPGTREGDDAPPPERHRADADTGFRAHNTNVYPQRPDRAYVGYIDGGMFILDIADKASPKMVSRWDNSPPYHGFTHTVLPLFDRDLLVVTDECVADDGGRLAEAGLGGRRARRAPPDADRHLPDAAGRRRSRDRGGRFGAHNLHENVPRADRLVQSDHVVFGTFFNGGLRAFDISNPYQPKEIGLFRAGGAGASPAGAIQINDVFVDERGIVYTVDRHGGGLYVLEMDF